MRRPSGARVLLATGLLLAVALGGLLSLQHAGLPRADFVFCNQAEPSSLDPALADGFAEGRLVSALFEGLTRLDGRTLEVLPGAARSWTTSPDGLRWTFELREEGRWSNGDALTADDFVHAYLRVLDPATVSGSARLLFALRGAREFHAGSPEGPRSAASVDLRAESPLRLVMDLAHPCAELPRLLAYPALAPVHRPSLEREPRTWLAPQRLVSNGPFRLAERRLNDRLRLLRNEHYWGAAEVALASVDALTASSVTTQLNLYLTGAADWIIRPPPGLSDVLLARPDARTGPQFGTTFLRFNVRRPPLDDPRLRQALLLALDRPTLATAIMGPGHLPSQSFVPPGAPGYTPARLPAPDPARARRLLAEAGHPGGQGLAPIELLLPHNEHARDLCQAVAEHWRRELGVSTRLVVQTWKVYLDSSRHGLYDAAWSSWIGDVLDEGPFLDVFRAESLSNRTGWADPGFDDLLDRAAASADPGLRAEWRRQAEQRLLDAAPIAPIHQRQNVNLVAARVTGFHDNLLDIHPLRDLGLAPAPQ